LNKIARTIVIALLFSFSVSAFSGEKEEIERLIGQFASLHTTESREAYHALVKKGHAAVGPLGEALSNPDRNIRWQAVQVLGAIGGHETVPLFMKAIRDEDKDVRRYAASYLGRHGKGNEKAVQALEAALSDPDPEVLSHIMGALDHLGQTRYRENGALLRNLCRDLKKGDDETRQFAAEALGKMRNDRACKPLVKALRYKGGKHRSCGASVLALEKIGSPKALPQLVCLLGDEKEEGAARSGAAMALQKLANPSVNRHILELTKSKDPITRSKAAKALGFKGNREVVDRLGEMAADTGEEASVRKEAVISLGNIGDPAGTDALCIALETGSLRVRREAALSLGEIGSPEAVPVLIESVKDPDPWVAMYSARSLGQIGDKRAVKAILTLFDRKDAMDLQSQCPYYANPATVANLALSKITGLPQCGEIDSSKDARENPGDDVEKTGNRVLSWEDAQKSRKKWLNHARKTWKERLGISDAESGE